MNFTYLTDPEHWDPSTPGGFPQLILSHLGYSALADPARHAGGRRRHELSH